MGRQTVKRVWKPVVPFALITIALSAASAISSANTPHARIPAGLDKIEHLIFIVQENRSFDHYFGTYPGADGIPRKAGGGFARSTCNWHPVLNKCLKPYHTSTDVQIGGPHAHPSSVIDVARGKMNGFIKGAATGHDTKYCTLDPMKTSCRKFEGPQRQPDVMSYRTRKDIPNYWALADYGALQDRLFASVDSFSLPAHMFIFSGWSASCSGGPLTCKSDYSPSPSNFNWTPIAFLLDKYGASWAWYVGEDTNICASYPKCPQSPTDKVTPTNWNPPPGFTYVKESDELDHILPVSGFREALTNGTLPAVSWVIPAERVSEHPGKGSMRPGYKYVSDLIQRIGSSSSWNSSAVFVYWDDWGGFYDHVKPLRVDGLGYGIRVPGLMVSPYAKEGYIDHQTLSFDAFLKLIEDRFTEGERLDPANPGFPSDARPSVRENVAGLGDLTQEFDFTQSPRPAPILPD